MMFPLERNNYKTTEISFTIIPSNRKHIHYKQIHEESLNFQHIDFNNLEELKHNERMTQETSLINLYKNQSNNNVIDLTDEPDSDEVIIDTFNNCSINKRKYCHDSNSMN